MKLINISKRAHSIHAGEGIFDLPSGVEVEVPDSLGVKLLRNPRLASRLQRVPEEPDELTQLKDRVKLLEAELNKQLNILERSS